MSFRPCAIVPSRNHWRAIGAVVDGLRRYGLTVIVVDDGSDEPAQSALAALHRPEGGVIVRRLPVNQGKGGAVMAGFALAEEMGFSHAVQVDADGQHDLGRLPDLLGAAAAHPEALVSGAPVYDHTVPRSRLIARWATHVWIWVETQSFRIKDSLCGFRVYPLAAVRAVLPEVAGRRMDFDPEIMVRLFWQGTPVIQLPVPVIYPEGNTSNFDLLRDNLRLSGMHTRLVLTMLARLPWILKCRPPQLGDVGGDWAALGERGAYWGMRLLAWFQGLSGRAGCMTLLWPIVAYFYATDPARRRASLDYLGRVSAAAGAPPPGWFDGLRHYMSFAGKALDAFVAWARPDRVGEVRVAGAEPLDELARQGRGVLLIVSHLGNAELSRARLAARFHRKINVLMHTRHAEQYNRLLRRFAPDVASDVLQVTDIGADTAVLLKERVERGEWIAIAGDRTPVGGLGRTSRVPFLGEAAPFSQGPFILAALMGCPVWLMVCLRDGDGGHTAHFELFAERIVLPRRDKEAALAELAGRYALRLESYCLRAPLQWYNFYDFWAAEASAGASR